MKGCPWKQGKLGTPQPLEYNLYANNVSAVQLSVIIVYIAGIGLVGEYWGERERTPPVVLNVPPCYVISVRHPPRRV